MGQVVSETSFYASENSCIFRKVKTCIHFDREMVAWNVQCHSLGNIQAVSPSLIVLTQSYPPGIKNTGLLGHDCLLDRYSVFHVTDMHKKSGVFFF